MVTAVRALQQPLERPYDALKQRALEHRLATAVLAVLAYGPPPISSAPSQQHRKAWASLSMGHWLRHRALQQPLERPYHALKQRALEHRLATAVLAVLENT